MVDCSIVDTPISAGAFPAKENRNSKRDERMRVNKKHHAESLCSKLYRELLVGKFASIKFSDEEKQELIDNIDHARNKIEHGTPSEIANITAWLYQGLTYITQEAPALESISIGWLTTTDVKHLMANR